MSTLPPESLPAWETCEASQNHGKQTDLRVLWSGWRSGLTYTNKVCMTNTFFLLQKKQKMRKKREALISLGAFMKTLCAGL